jgi:transglutaminase-like putative cysteine protease
MDNMEKYLRCSDIVDCDAALIKKKATALTKGLKTDKEKAIALFYFARDTIKYNPYDSADRYEYSMASATLKRSYGLCFQKAAVLIAMCRAVGIPARFGFADIRNHLMSERFLQMMCGSNILVYHGFAEIYIDGKWVIATPAFDLETCRENGYIPVEFDGEHDARASRYSQDGRPHIEYLKYHGSYDDLPWQEIYKAGAEHIAGLGVDVDKFMAKWRTNPPGK